MKKHNSATSPASKLSFSKEIVRRLADTLTDDQLANVEGGGGKVGETRSKATVVNCD